MLAALSSLAAEIAASEIEQRGGLDGLKKAVVRQYAMIVHATYADVPVQALEAAVETFFRQPDENNLNKTRKAWIDARVPYLQTEACRFYDGPIEEVEGFINAWPIDENLIDYVEGDPEAGIINQPHRYPEITAELLTVLNEKQGERSITTGFHAIEFLLWGQDLFDDGPGRRSHRDYTDARNFGRRRTYLRTATQLLAEHIRLVVAAWSPACSTNYRARFEAMEPDLALANILKGIGTLSAAELAGERLTVAYETKEQEDEHSCFSDTTHLDFLYDAIGIQNIYHGRYTRTDGRKLEGPSPHDLLLKIDPNLALKLAAEIDASIRAVRAIPKPFDQAVLGTDSAPGRIAIRNAIKALQAQATTIARAAAALNIRLNL